MGKLILSGGGNAQQALTINKFFVQSTQKNKPILYIPIAGGPSFRPYSNSLEYIKSMLNPLGIEEIIMWTDVQNKTLEDLKPFSAVYIGGGNAVGLLNTFKRAAFDKVIKEYLDSGGTIYGQSAGAMIFGKYIIKLESEFLKGMNAIINLIPSGVTMIKKMMSLLKSM